MSKWLLSGVSWQATVVVEPGRWIGLEFAVPDHAGRPIHYGLDTDLYDLSQEKNREFAEEIERDVIEFLGHLRDRRVLLRKDRPVVVFPLDGGYVRLVRGRFLTHGSTHTDLARAQAGGEYAPVE